MHGCVCLYVRISVGELEYVHHLSGGKQLMAGCALLMYVHVFGRCCIQHVVVDTQRTILSEKFMSITTKDENNESAAVCLTRPETMQCGVVENCSWRGRLPARSEGKLA